MALAETIQYAVVAALVLVGSFFLLVGTIGLIRLPTVYNRMHATSKATTLGAASMFLAGFVYFDFQGVGLESLVGILFLFLTAPTGAHMISRSARKMGVDFVEEVEWPVSGAGIDTREPGRDESAQAGDD
ncbi:monovalent cation/H(+) antiporter subunit G [Haloarchaeobius sp. DFWS5]|uniref:monovalent cation/H(+) antiporter subunit G n=1 Tax=Haloarchaeobius sp. DFWS5 TaxID=3446114 RepID=UPI003EB8290E